MTYVVYRGENLDEEHDESIVWDKDLSFTNKKSAEDRANYLYAYCGVYTTKIVEE